MATELKNNKLARWTAQALLSGVDMMKLGYVSRADPRDRHNHVIVGVIGHNPRDLAAEIDLNMTNMWGILKSLVDLSMKLEEGKYACILLNSPVEPQVTIYQLPSDSFDKDHVEPFAGGGGESSDDTGGTGGRGWRNWCGIGRGFCCCGKIGCLFS